MIQVDPITCHRKTCAVCRARLSLDEFPADATRKDGRYPICSWCRRDYRVCPRWRPESRDCAICGETFAPWRWDKLTCSKDCAREWYRLKLGRASWKHTAAWCWLDDLFHGIWLVTAGNNREIGDGFRLLKETHR